MARLFYALRPDEAAARSLAAIGAELAARAGGRLVPRDNLHLTLAFLGEVGRDRAALARQLSMPARAPFGMVLDRTGSFRGAKVAWAGSRNPPPPLLALQAALDSAVRHAGFEVEDRPFVPHVTLVRRIERPAGDEPMPPIAWRATEIVLMSMQPGAARYSTLRSWALEES